MWWIIAVVGVVAFAYVIIVMSSNYTVKQMIEQNFEKECSLGLTGAQFAYAFLKMSGVETVEVQFSEKDGQNFYVPKQKIVVLEQKVCYGTSLSSIAIAGHEASHAIQHSKKEFAWGFNRVLKFFTLFCSVFIFPVIISALILLLIGHELATPIMLVGAVMISLMIILKISTIALERNASNKAIKFIKKHGNLKAKEIKIIKNLLKYAELTYVSDLFSSLFNINRLRKI